MAKLIYETPAGSAFVSLTVGSTSTIGLHTGACGMSCLSPMALGPSGQKSHANVLRRNSSAKRLAG
jgi:hypothetical protein